MRFRIGKYRNGGPWSGRLAAARPRWPACCCASMIPHRAPRPEVDETDVRDFRTAETFGATSDFVTRIRCCSTIPWRRTSPCSTRTGCRAHRRREPTSPTRGSSSTNCRRGPDPHRRWRGRLSGTTATAGHCTCVVPRPAHFGVRMRPPAPSTPRGNGWSRPPSSASWKDARRGHCPPPLHRAPCGPHRGPFGGASPRPAPMRSSGARRGLPRHGDPPAIGRVTGCPPRRTGANLASMKGATIGAVQHFRKPVSGLPRRASIPRPQSLPSEDHEHCIRAGVRSVGRILRGSQALFRGRLRELCAHRGAVGGGVGRAVHLGMRSPSRGFRPAGSLPVRPVVTLLLLLPLVQRLSRSIWIHSSSALETAVIRVDSLHGSTETKRVKMERVLAFEDPFVSPNRLFPCGSGCNQNRYPIPEWVLWGYNSRKKNRSARQTD